MHAALAKRVDQLVEIGWQPVTTTETTVSLFARRPFNWWLFVFLIIFFPAFGGILYLIFWLLTSRATVFLHSEGDEVVHAGDLWLVHAQEQRREFLLAQQKRIREKGFLAVMWPQLLVFLLMLGAWVWFLRWYF